VLGVEEGNVLLAVAVEVLDYLCSGAEAELGHNRVEVTAVAEAQEHAEGVGAGIDGDQVLNTVVIEVLRVDAGGAVEGHGCVRRPDSVHVVVGAKDGPGAEAARAVVEQHGNIATDLVAEQDVRGTGGPRHDHADVRVALPNVERPSAAA